jgi:hypothetical protein
MKNERAAIMALTFCIGFTTGLIAYGIPAADVPVATPAVQVASLSDTPVAAPPALPAPTADFLLNDSGLYYLANDIQQIVSPSSALINIPEAHSAVYAPLMSPDGQYLFYCAETAATPGRCFPRVYDSSTVTVHSVSQGGSAAPVTITELEVGWVDDDTLFMNGQRTVPGALVWVLR